MNKPLNLKHWVPQFNFISEETRKFPKELCHLITSPVTEIVRLDLKPTVSVQQSTSQHIFKAVISHWQVTLQPFYRPLHGLNKPCPPLSLWLHSAYPIWSSALPRCLTPMASVHLYSCFTFPGSFGAFDVTLTCSSSDSQASYTLPTPEPPVFCCWCVDGSVLEGHTFLSPFNPQDWPITFIQEGLSLCF